MPAMEDGTNRAMPMRFQGVGKVLNHLIRQDRRTIGPTAELLVVPGEEASPALLRQVHEGFKRTFLRCPENFVWFEKDELAREDRVIAAIVENGQVTAGMHYDRAEFSGVPCAYFKGLFSNSKTKGLASELIVNAFGYEATQRGDQFGGLATVRQYADGRFNPAAVATFEGLGFRSHSSQLVELTTSDRHRHLIPTANVRDGDKCGFEVMHMFCNVERAANLVRSAKVCRRGK